MVASEIFRREGLRRRIASRIQYALPVVQKPSRENRPTGVFCTLSYTVVYSRYMFRMNMGVCISVAEGVKIYLVVNFLGNYR